MSDFKTPLLSTGGEDGTPTTTTAAVVAQDNLAHAVRVIGKVLLWCDLIWDIAWTVIAIIIAVRTTPLPSSLVSGLPLAVYDRTAEYRNAHYGIALHGFLPSVYFSLAAGYIIATAAIVLSTAVFLWYQAAYWHFRWTGRHFNDLGQQQQRQQHRDDEPFDDTRPPMTMMREQRIKMAAHVAVNATQPRLRTAP